MKVVKKFKIGDEIPSNAKYIGLSLIGVGDVTGVDDLLYEVPIKDGNKKTVNDDEIRKTITRVIDYLNKKINGKYTYKVKSHNAKIMARMQEGAKPEDFKTVIDNMCREWLDSDRMRKYIRPDTLFSAKFWNYLSSETAPTTDEALAELDKLIEKA